MQGPNAVLNVLTIPPGATEYDQRIIINGLTGAIFGYGPGTSSDLPYIVQSLVIPDALAGSFDKPTTKGNCVAVAVNAFNSTSGHTPSVSGVTLGGGGSFTAMATAVSAYDGNQYNLAALWADPDCAGGQTAVAVSGTDLTVNANFGITIYEIGNMVLSGVLDKESTQTSTAEPTWTSGTMPTTTVPTEIWMGVNTCTTDVTALPTSPWINNVYSSADIGNGYQIVSAVGGTFYSGTQTTSAGYATLIASLKGAANVIQTPGPLLFALANEQGTDPVFNQLYYAGLTTYSQTVKGTYVNVGPLGISFGQAGADNTADITSNAPGQLTLTSGQVSGEQQAVLYIESADASNNAESAVNVGASNLQVNGTDMTVP